MLRKTNIHIILKIIILQVFIKKINLRKNVSHSLFNYYRIGNSKIKTLFNLFIGWRFTFRGPRGRESSCLPQSGLVIAMQFKYSLGTIKPGTQNNIVVFYDDDLQVFTNAFTYYIFHVILYTWALDRAAV